MWNILFDNIFQIENFKLYYSSHTQQSAMSTSDICPDHIDNGKVQTIFIDTTLYPHWILINTYVHTLKKYYLTRAEKAHTQCKFANWRGIILPWEIISHLSCSLLLTNLTYFAHWNDSFSFVFVCKYCNFHLSLKLSFYRL